MSSGVLTRSPQWPPDYVSLIQWRQSQVLRMQRDESFLAGAKLYYSTRPGKFIGHWCNTVDPRNAGGVDALVRMPFVLFRRQEELVQFLHECLMAEESGLVEKSRDMGATWASVAFSVWLWLFQPGSSVGWGSRKAVLVDRIGDMDSIFEKARSLIRGLPRVLWPRGFGEDCMTYMKILNPESESSITGESGDDIGRGGRKRIYFKDESAHYERPESIEAALADNTRVQIDISSVHGLGNVFHRRRESGVEWEPGRGVTAGKTQVFIMDWRDHPAKDQAWYDAREAKAIDDGLLHVFRQEVDRSYDASVEGTIIPAEWVRSAIDAHEKIPELDSGCWGAALDVADGGGDRNALAKRKGVVLRYCDEWGERDTGATARRAIMSCSENLPVTCQYDCIGVGSGIKAETNRLRDDGLMPRGLLFVPWDAGAAPQDKEKRVVEHERDSPLNKDFYYNLKAQGWWLLRRRFEKTHRAIVEGVSFPPDELISISSAIPRLRQLQKELSQPTASQSTSRLKLKVDKAPEGTRSPNLGDAVMMCYHPMRVAYDSTLSWVS